ncbi:MAG: PD-(D/E)XK nuclease family protein [Elusimicrobiales bacterium]|jgi:DNA helicase-2/ATP-dependent DNA helicase PcrA
MHSDPFELNFSKVKAYRNCPYLYKYIYLDRKYAPHTPFSALGISVHRALDKYHSKGGDLDDLMLYYDEGWHHHGFATPQQTLEFYARGRKILENYRRAESDAALAEVVFTEKEFEFEFERWRVRGTMDRVDRVNGGYELIDYKMGFEPKTAEELVNDLQLSMYAIGLKKAFGMSVKTVSWFLLVKGEKLSAPYDPSGEGAVLDLLRETGERILALDLSRKGKCEVCAIKQLCAVSQAK